MHSVSDFGLLVIHWVQQARTPLLDRFFEGVSGAGSEYFYFAALPIICTLINRKIGLRIAFTVLASVMINSVIKSLVGESRPFIFDPLVAVVPESGFAFPSGHMQSATVFWGLAILYVRQWWMTAFAAVWVGLIGLSRIYLGAHFPTDVLGSLLVGSVIVFAHTRIVASSESWWRPDTKWAVFGVVMLLGIAGSYFISNKDMISAAALSSGLVAGLLFNNSMAPLSENWRQRIVASMITGVVLLVIYAGLKAGFPAKGQNHYEIFSFVRFFLCGLALSGFPLLLQKRVTPRAA